VKVITLAKTKELLGIGDTAQDAAITAKIPYIDSKVKQITNNRYNLMIYGDMTLDSLYMSVYSILASDGTRFEYKTGKRRWYVSGINNPYWLDDIGDYLETGQLLEGTGIQDDTYIDDIIYNGGSYVADSVTNAVPVIKMSATATATASEQQVFLGINIAYQDIIAKGIQYLINGTSTAIPGALLKSESIGTYSYTNADTKINTTYGMPQWFVDSFPRTASGH